jgi:hypothetical protein
MVHSGCANIAAAQLHGSGRMIETSATVLVGPLTVLVIVGVFVKAAWSELSSAFLLVRSCTESGTFPSALIFGSVSVICSLTNTT